MNSSESKNAYGTFIFKDGGYLPGLLMVAYRLRKLKTKARIICCHTDDIPKNILNVLYTLYDELISIDYLKVGRKRSGRQAPLPWMFTRFRLLGLSGVDKLIVLDADMLPINSYDSIFELSSPAGVINESKDKIIGSLKTSEKIESWEWHKNYGLIAPPCSIIPKYITDRPLSEPENNMGINGGLMMFSPSDEKLKDFLSWCELNQDVINKMNWPDMQSITAYFSGSWVNIDASYLGLHGYPNLKSLNGVHFVGPKPWQWKSKGFEYRIKNYPDYKLWAEEFMAMCNENQQLLKLKSIQALFNELSEFIA